MGVWREGERRREKDNECTAQHKHQTDHLLLSKLLLPGAHNALSPDGQQMGGVPPMLLTPKNFCKLTPLILLIASWDFIGQK